MKKSLLVLCACVAAALHGSAQGLEGIIVEKYYISDANDSTNAADNFSITPLRVGSVTYRVYADLLPGYKLIQVFGNQNHELNFSTTTDFYNDPNYGFSVYMGTSVLNTRKNTTLIDSYLTAGGVANGLMGVLKTEDTDGSIGNIQNILANNDPAAGIPINGTNASDGLMPGTAILPNTLGLTTELDVFDQTAGGSFSTYGGTIAALGGAEGVTQSNHVLIGQFTTSGTFSFKLNLQISTPVEGESEIYVADNVQTGELTDSTLIYTSESVVPNNIADEQVSTDWSIFPNPTTDLIQVQFNRAVGQGSVVIYDAIGNQVLAETVSGNQKSISMSSLPNGIYLVRAFSGSQTIGTQTIVKL
jgi:hypothetical protein